MITSFGAAADDASAPDLAAIRAQQASIRVQVEEGTGLFEEMNAPERRVLVQRQTELLSLLKGKNTIDDLDDRDQVRAFNLLAEIDATIMGQEDQRMVCELVEKTGSHRKVKQCFTVAQRRQLREDATRTIQKAQTGRHL